MSTKITTTSKGGTKPHAHLLSFMALVLFGIIALVGVAAADNVWGGTPPETKLSGVVNGSVWVNLSANDPWSTTAPQREPQYNWGNFTLPKAPSNVSLKEARLYVTVYGGNNTAHGGSPDWYTGNLSVGLSNGNNLVEKQPLNLDWDNTSISLNHTAYNTSITAPLVNLSRVSSDYLAIFDIKNNISSLNTTVLNVNTTSYNSTGRFDGRIKEIKLVIVWNETDGSSTGNTLYWINEGHDANTQFGNGNYNKTWFNNTGITNQNFTATLWTDFLCSNTTGNGVYKWNGEDISPSLVKQWKYAGLSKLIWGLADFAIDSNNYLEYKNATTTVYKIIVTVLAIKIL